MVEIAVLDAHGDAAVEENVTTAVAAIADASARGAHLLVFGECFLTGYDLDVDELHHVALDVDADAWARIAEAAARHRMHVAIGSATTRDGRYFNSLRLYRPDGRFEQYDKSHIPQLGLDRWVQPGRDRFDRPVATPIGALGLTICYDIRFPEAIRSLALHGAQIVLVPACYPAGSERVPELFPRVRAMENGVYVVMAAAGGQVRGRSYAPGSQIVGPNGDALHRRIDGTDLLVGTVSPDAAGRSGRSASYRDYSLDIYADRRPDCYSL